MNTLLKCPCQICGEQIEFEAAMTHQKALCPHCQCETMLQSKRPVAITVPQAPAPQFRIHCEPIPQKWGVLLWLIPSCLIGGVILAWFGHAGDQTDSMEVGSAIGAIFGGCLAVIIYFVPTIVAQQNKKRNLAAICVLNIFLGWTLVGWVVALVWALTKDDGAAPHRSLEHIHQSRRR